MISKNTYFYSYVVNLCYQRPLNVFRTILAIEQIQYDISKCIYPINVKRTDVNLKYIMSLVRARTMDWIFNVNISRVCNNICVFSIHLS